MNPVETSAVWGKISTSLSSYGSLTYCAMRRSVSEEVIMSATDDQSKIQPHHLLRKCAEKALQKRLPDDVERVDLSKEETNRLIHELQVHQIELEMQNDELRRIQNEIVASRDKYSELFERYSSLYDFAPVGYFTLKEKGIIEQANLTGATLLGMERQSLIGKPLTRFISKEDQDIFYLHHTQVVKKKGNHTCELKMMRDGDASFIGQLESKAEQDKADNVVHVRTAITDITDRKITQHRLQASLREKQVLLQEVHHRVKNNMQVIISLINLKCEKIEDPNIRDLFRQTVDRINSMALVHTQLYKSKDFSEVNICHYIKSIVEHLFQSHGVNPVKIRFIMDSTDRPVSLDSAINCGLIVNEVVTNSIKYAFPEEQTGEIRVGFERRDDGALDMHVSDNGVGMPTSYDVRDIDTLGFKIIHAVAEHQLGGTLNLDRTNGTHYSIRFKDRFNRGDVENGFQD